MERDRVLQILQAHAQELRGRGVKTLVLIGPAARGEAHPGSEIDFLLELHPPLTFDHYRQVRDYLQELLANPVEVMLESPHHPLIWPLIQEEAVFVW